MSWINNDNYPLNKVYKTSSKSVDEIVKDISVVVKQVLKMKEIDKAESAKSILFYANATNGYIGIYLYDINEFEEVGNSSYLLELPELWDLSINHIDGAYYYDEMTEKAIRSFASNPENSDLKKDYKLYFSNELDDPIEM